MIIKFGFTIKNIQLALTEYDIPLLTVRYWSIEPYKIINFNVFIFFSLKEDILKCVINNGMSRSSLRFNKFVYLSLKILGENYKFIR